MLQIKWSCVKISPCDILNYVTVLLQLLTVKNKSIKMYSDKFVSIPNWVLEDRFSLQLLVNDVMGVIGCVFIMCLIPFACTKDS